VCISAIFCFYLWLPPAMMIITYLYIMRSKYSPYMYLRIKDTSMRWILWSKQTCIFDEKIWRDFIYAQALSLIRKYISIPTTNQPIATHYYGNTSVTPIDNSVGSLIVRCTMFHTINFPYFHQYSPPVLHVIEWRVKADVLTHLPWITHTNIQS
jgi:hypothetical protein